MTDRSDDIPFDRSMAARPEEVQAMSPLVRRLIANNGGPFTFTGTCTYVVGHGRVAVIDPGPNDHQHLAALKAMLADEVVDHILVTHTHRDHSPGAATLKTMTGAPILGCAPYGSGQPSPMTSPSDAANDADYRPDHVLADGERVQGADYDLFAVATPGHAANHLAFALPQEQALFSGDHVMAWSTSVVAPPDGSMRAYMASLEKLRARQDIIYWPGHGGPVRNPQRFVRALLHHRRQRESAILARLAEGDSAIDTLVARLYVDLAPQLRKGAAMSVLAHLEDLVERGLVVATGAPPLRAHYALT